MQENETCERRRGAGDGVFGWSIVVLIVHYVCVPHGHRMNVRQGKKQGGD